MRRERAMRWLGDRRGPPAWRLFALASSPTRPIATPTGNGCAVQPCRACLSAGPIPKHADGARICSWLASQAEPRLPDGSAA